MNIHHNQPNMLCKFAHPNVQIKLCRFITLSVEVGLPPDLPMRFRSPFRAKTHAPGAPECPLVEYRQGRACNAGFGINHTPLMSNGRKFPLARQPDSNPHVRATGNARLPGHEHGDGPNHIMR